MKRSFKSTIKKVGLPIIKMNLYGKGYNFLIDTGSSANHIAATAYSDFEDKVTIAGYCPCVGIDGKSIHMKVVDVAFPIDTYMVRNQFSVIDNLDCFDAIDKETGCRISGILGTPFLSSCQITIDYGKMCISSHFKNHSFQSE